MADGPALTIGEVINLLKDEFPDVTVSKVRFLESQGLITPARSTSGYRSSTPPRSNVSASFSSSSGIISFR